MIPKTSIIVPIYNVEKYFDKCVNSLINQTLKDIEIILVDDGSLDNSGKMADEYALKDKRIKVFHQTNKGLGPARNSGIKLATGEYVAFVDSDDWVNLDMYEKLYSVAVKNNSDIVVGGHSDMVDGIPVITKVHPLAGKTYRTQEEILKIRKNFFGHLPTDKLVEAFPMAAWISIYRRSMIVDNNLQFEKILSEDTIFNLSVYEFAKIVSFTSFTDYCYRKDDQTSITQSFSSNKLAQYENYLSKLYSIAEKEQDDECKLRAKRMAIDCSRLYVRIVDNTNESFKMKRTYVKEFAENESIRNYWKDYPYKKLPIKQLLFYLMIEKKMYGVALIMTRLRYSAQKRKRK